MKCQIFKNILSYSYPDTCQLNDLKTTYNIVTVALFTSLEKYKVERHTIVHNKSVKRQDI